MRRKPLLLVALSLAVGAGALVVGGPAPAGPKVKGLAEGEIVAAVCDTIAKDSECGEVVVTDKAKKGETLKLLKKMCPTAKAGSGCPAAKQVGTCRVGKDIINHFYAKGPKAYTADTAKEKCEKGAGRWVE